MEATPTPAQCLSQFERLESDRTHLLSELSAWLPGRLSFRPAPGTWSAIEVLDHIVRSEAGLNADIRSGLRNPHTLGAEERPRIANLRNALRSDKTFRVPPGAEAILPDDQTTFADVTSRWEQARTDLRSIVEALSPDQTGCGVFQHPFAGWMTVSDVLDHLADHLHHHRFQLARLEASSESLTSPGR